MVVITAENVSETPAPLMNSEMGVKRLIIKTNNGAGTALLLTNPDNLDYTLIGGSINGQIFEINFLDEPYGYPRISDIYVYGSNALIMADLDSHSVSASEYFTFVMAGE